MAYGGQSTGYVDCPGCGDPEILDPRAFGWAPVCAWGEGFTSCAGCGSLVQWHLQAGALMLGMMTDNTLWTTRV